MAALQAPTLNFGIMQRPHLKALMIDRSNQQQEECPTAQLEGAEPAVEYILSFCSEEDGL